MRILIVKMSALGDIIHALPVLDHIKRIDNSIEIDWVVEEQFREILVGNPHISLIIEVRTKAWRRRPFASVTRHEISAVKRTLRSRKYDLVLDIQGNLKSGLIDWLSDTSVIYGFSAESLQERINTFFTTHKIQITSDDYHVTDQYLRVAAAAFKTSPVTTESAFMIFPSQEDYAHVEQFLHDLGIQRFILFHCGTTWQTKYWSEENWIVLGRTILQTWPEVSLLLSSGNDEEYVDAQNFALKIGRRALAVKRLPLKRFAALMSKASLVVGGDTGPVHIAAAVGAATVSLYRSSDGRRSGPRGENHAIIQAPLECTACFRTRCSRDQACRDSITPEMVMECAKSLYRREQSLEREPIIAIDGPSGAGKSTLSKLLAKRLGFINIDTGAMYRCVALAARRCGIGPEDHHALDKLVRNMAIEFKRNDSDERVLLDQEDVTTAIRSPEVSLLTSKISAVPQVRRALVELQRRFGNRGGVVLEGRDIGTVVFPNAEVKFFLVATPQERGRRRFEELKAKGLNVDLMQTIAEVEARDEADSAREHAPLKKAYDAVEIDTTGMTIDQVLDKLYKVVAERRIAFKKTGLAESDKSEPVTV